MKKIFWALALLLPTTHLWADDYHYLTFNFLQTPAKSFPLEGLKITFPQEGTLCAHTATGEHTYQLDALRNMVFTTDNLTAITPLEAPVVATATYAAGVLTTTSVPGCTVAVWNLAGKRVATYRQTTAHTAHHLALTPGMYLIQIGTRSVKMIVK